MSAETGWRLGRRWPFRGLLALRGEYPRVVLVLAAGDLVASFGFSLFFPFLTIYLVQTLGASAAEAGLVIAAYSLCSIVSGIVGGWLADRIGRRPVLIGSISCSTVLVFSMAFVTQAWQVGLVMLLLGCIDPAFVPAARAAVADAVEEERRPRVFGLLAVANAVGWIAGPVIGAGLSTVGYPLLFAISGLLIGAYVVIAGRWLPETRPAEAPPPPCRCSRSAPAGAGAVGVPVAIRQGRSGPSRWADRARRQPIGPARLRSLRRLPAAAWPSTQARRLPVGDDAADLRRRGRWAWRSPLWGLLFGLNGLLIVAFQMRVSRAGREARSKPRLMALSLGLYLAGLAVVAAVLSSAVGGGGPRRPRSCWSRLGELVLMPIVPAFVSDLAPAHRRGAFTTSASRSATSWAASPCRPSCW